MYSQEINLYNNSNLKTFYINQGLAKNLGFKIQNINCSKPKSTFIIFFFLWLRIRLGLDLNKIRAYPKISR